MIYTYLIIAGIQDSGISTSIMATSNSFSVLLNPANLVQDWNLSWTIRKSSACDSAFSMSDYSIDYGYLETSMDWDIQNPSN